MKNNILSIVLLSVGLLNWLSPFCYAQVTMQRPLTSSLPEELELEAFEQEKAGARTLARVAYGRSIIERAKTEMVTVATQGVNPGTTYLYHPYEDILIRGNAFQKAGQAQAAEDLYATTLKKLTPHQGSSSSARRLQQQLYLLESGRGLKNAEQRLANLTRQVLNEWGPYSELYISLLYEQIQYYDRKRMVQPLSETLQQMSSVLRQRDRNLAAFLLNDSEYDTFLTLHQRYIDQLLSLSVKYNNEEPGLANLVADYLLVSRNLQLNGQRILREHFIVRNVADMSIAIAMSIGIPYIQESLKKLPTNSKEYQEALTDIEKRRIIARNFENKTQRQKLYDTWKVAKSNPASDSKELSKLEHQLIDSVGRFIDQLVLPGIDAVVNRLQMDQAIVDFFSYERGAAKSDIQYAAVIYRKQPATPSLVLLGSKAEVWQLISQQRMQSSMSAYQLMTSINQLYKTTRLYDLLWKPLMPTLSGIRQVDYLPVDLLNSVAFDALQTEPGKNVLGEKFALKRVLTIPAAFADSVIIAPDKLPERQVNADFWGGISYNTKAIKMSEESSPIGLPLRGSVTTLTRGRNWQDLKGTEEEIQKVERLLKAFKKRSLDLYSKRKASEFAFKFQYSNLSQPQILHIATHGFYDNMTLKNSSGKVGVPASPYNEAMLKAGLVMAGANIRPEAGEEDGILTALEISRLNLNSKLVVLSACESGLGEQRGNEGIYGLQRAFKMAGAEFLLMTLWQIPDQETTEMMVFFYGNLIKGQSIETAFRNAQLSMKSKYSPFYWACFTLLR